MAALDSSCQPSAARRPAAAGKRRIRAVITGAAVCGAVAVVLTGPPRPLSFDMRLPLVVLGLGALWTVLAARRPAGVKRPTVPMATPWLVLTSTAGIALLTIKVLTADPALEDVFFAAGGAACCLAVGVCVTGGRRDGAAGLRTRCGPTADLAPETERREHAHLRIRAR